MKKLGLFNKILYLLNVLVAVALFFSFLLPYVPPASFPALSVLSLLVSPLLFLNFVFALYWVLRLNRRFLLSLSVLVVAFFYYNAFFHITSKKAPVKDKQLSVLTYNVRLFNAYEKNPSENATRVLKKVIEEENPDVLFVQEYYANTGVDFSTFPYKYIHFEGKNKLGHAIFSKYKMINTGAFDFKNSNNNALYATLVVGADTIQAYNLHLQSLGIKPSVVSLEESNKEKLIKRIGDAFTLQQAQAQLVKNHIKQAAYPVILGGDFNNTPFSYVYRVLQEDLKDAYVEAGKGLGTTYNFDSYPMRIDYIFTSPSFTILDCKTLSYTSSDHYPVKAIVGW